ncbi:MAG: lamin tail domain-containing protein, partial [Verrucomicrobiae bacterium]|nr:lamin tail domain-containing protein [Verrucomicrobiae bacterium]
VYKRQVQDEYVEIHNPNQFPIPLGGPGQQWRLSGGVSFAFPANAAIPPNGFAIVVSFDPSNLGDLNLFTRKYGILTPNAVIFGPYAGKLANDVDEVILEKAVPNTANDKTTIWTVVDEVNYADCWPWPENLPDGKGFSLQRIDSQTCKSRGWSAMAPTPGLPWFAESRTDYDLDGLPDAWEIQNGLSPTENQGDDGPTGDPDNDALDNLSEWLAGTAPKTVTLMLTSATITTNGLEVQVNLPANMNVQLEVCDTIGEQWIPVVSWPATPKPRLAGTIVPVTQPPTTGKFCRLVGFQ